jgi:hypothetical protein
MIERRESYGAQFSFQEKQKRQCPTPGRILNAIHAKG